MDPFAAEEPAKPVRRHFGCLWGCLGVLAVFLLLTGGGISYTAWTLYKAMQDDPQLTTILDTVRADPRAADVTGGDFHVMQVERLTFPLPGGHRYATTYKILEPSAAGKTIVSLTLTGPDGRVVRLIPKAAGSADSNSI